MLKFGKRTLIGVTISNRTVHAISKGADTVIEFVRTCYGSGQWIENKPWLNDDTWKNEKKN